MFAELVASGDPRYRGIVGLVTDLRLQRRARQRGRRRDEPVRDRRDRGDGRVCWSVDEAVEALRELAAAPLAALDEPVALGHDVADAAAERRARVEAHPREQARRRASPAGRWRRCV